jgi:hypothetical protein
MTILPYQLTDGSFVAARWRGGILEPFRFSNLTQARVLAARLTVHGVQAFVHSRRPFYVSIPQALISCEVTR